MNWKKITVGIVGFAMVLSMFGGLGGFAFGQDTNVAEGEVLNAAPGIKTPLALASGSGTLLENTTDGFGMLPAVFPQSMDTLNIEIEFHDMNSDDSDNGGLGGETINGSAACYVEIYEDQDYNGVIDPAVDVMVRNWSLEAEYASVSNPDVKGWTDGAWGDTFGMYGDGNHTNGDFWPDDGHFGVNDLMFRVDDGAGGPKLNYTVTGRLHGVRVNFYDDDGAWSGYSTIEHFYAFQLWKVLGVYDAGTLDRVPDGTPSADEPEPFTWPFNSTYPAEHYANPAETYVYSTNVTSSNRAGLVIQWLAPAGFADLTITMGTDFEPSTDWLKTDYGIPTAKLDWRVGEDSGNPNPTGEVDAPSGSPATWNYSYISGVDGGTSIQVDLDTGPGTIDFRQYDIMWFIYTLGNDPALADSDTNPGLPLILPDDTYTSSVTLGAA